VASLPQERWDNLFLNLAWSSFLIFEIYDFSGKKELLFLSLRRDKEWNPKLYPWQIGTVVIVLLLALGPVSLTWLAGSARSSASRTQNHAFGCEQILLYRCGNPGLTSWSFGTSRDGFAWFLMINFRRFFRF
jgi:hypothetical protein